MEEVFMNLTEADLLLLDTQTPIPEPPIRWQRASCDFVVTELASEVPILVPTVSIPERLAMLTQFIQQDLRVTEPRRCNSIENIINVFMPDGSELLLCQNHFAELQAECSQLFEEV